MKVIRKTVRLTGKTQTNELLELKPLALQLSADGARPVLLLRNESKNLTMPVILSPLEAGVTVSQMHRQGAAGTPHRASGMILQAVGAQIVRAVFTKIQHGILFLRLEFKGQTSLTEITLRADEALSLCLHLQVPFFASEDLIHESKAQSVDQADLQRRLSVKPHLMKNPHHYLM